MFWLNPFARIHRSILNLGELIMVTATDHAKRLDDLTAQNEKAATEQAAALQNLQDKLDAMPNGTTPEVDAALDRLAASIQREDDLNPDTTTPPPGAPTTNPPTGTVVTPGPGNLTGGNP